MKIVIDDSQHPFNIEKFYSLSEGSGTLLMELMLLELLEVKEQILKMRKKISGVAPEVKLIVNESWSTLLICIGFS